MTANSAEITQLLKAWRHGDSAALDRLTPVAYDDAREVDWQDRAHFFAVSAGTMRRVLVDAARTRASLKRGGRVQRVEHSGAVNLHGFPAPDSNIPFQLCALDDASKPVLTARFGAPPVSLRPARCRGWSSPFRLHV